MNRIAILALSAALFTASDAAAQKMGATNTNAPEIEQAIDLGPTGRVELSYTAITWAAGRWAKTLEDEERRERMKSRINGSAKQSPLGYFSAGSDILLGDVRVPEGDYKLGFTLDDDYAWRITLFGADSEIHVPLGLRESPMESKRLIVSFYAGDEDFTGGIYVAFGKQTGDIAIKAAPSEG